MGLWKIYHITHVDNLPAMLSQGGLWSDAQRIARQLQTTLVGMAPIKQRRLQKLEVRCQPGTKVGEYVPFYFCPRSIMLYILYQSNHPELTYRGGQQPIVHLVADLEAVVSWADANAVPWAFTNTNAAAAFADFFNRLADIDQIDWKAVTATDWRSPEIRERKQAEFLVKDWFPWQLVEKIGVQCQATRSSVMASLGNAARPTVSVEPSWYYQERM